MEQVSWDIILKIAGLVTIICFAVIAGGTLKNVKLAEFGEDDNSKRKVAMKLVANIFIFLGLGTVLVAGIFKLFNEQVTLLLFVACLGGLGVKLLFDLKG